MKKNTFLSALGALAVGAGVALTGGATADTAVRGSPEEIAAYEAAVAAGTEGALQVFLRQYPDSPYTASVFSQLNELVPVQVAQEWETRMYGA